MGGHHQAESVLQDEVRSAREVNNINLNGKSPEMSQSQSQGITEQEAPAPSNEKEKRSSEQSAVSVTSMLGNSAKLTKRSRRTKEM